MASPLLFHMCAPSPSSRRRVDQKPSSANGHQSRVDCQTGHERRVLQLLLDSGDDQPGAGGRRSPGQRKTPTAGTVLGTRPSQWCRSPKNGSEKLDRQPICADTNGNRRCIANGSRWFARNGKQCSEAGSFEIVVHEPGTEDRIERFFRAAACRRRPPNHGVAAFSYIPFV